jgi:hypothetical protein
MEQERPQPEFLGHQTFSPDLAPIFTARFVACSVQWRLGLERSRAQVTKKNDSVNRALSYEQVINFWRD